MHIRRRQNLRGAGMLVIWLRAPIPIKITVRTNQDIRMSIMPIAIRPTNLEDMTPYVELDIIVPIEYLLLCPVNMPVPRALIKVLTIKLPLDYLPWYTVWRTRVLRQDTLILGVGFHTCMDFVYPTFPLPTEQATISVTHRWAPR
jgi:hypothetical protein